MDCVSDQNPYSHLCPNPVPGLVADKHFRHKESVVFSLSSSDASTGRASGFCRRFPRGPRPSTMTPHRPRAGCRQPSEGPIPSGQRDVEDCLFLMVAKKRRPRKSPNQFLTLKCNSHLEKKVMEMNIKKFLV